MVVDLDGLRTELHERAVVVRAKWNGQDPDEALAFSRFLRARLMAKGTDLRLSIQAARATLEAGPQLARRPA